MAAAFPSLPPAVMVTSQKGGVEKPREGSSAHKRAGNHKHSVSFRGRPKTKSFGQKWDEGFFGRNFQILEKTDRIIIACVLFSLSILERHEFLSKCYQLCWGPAFFFLLFVFSCTVEPLVCGWGWSVLLPPLPGAAAVGGIKFIFPSFGQVKGKGCCLPNILWRISVQQILFDNTLSPDWASFSCVPLTFFSVKIKKNCLIVSFCLFSRSASTLTA